MTDLDALLAEAATHTPSAARKVCQLCGWLWPCLPVRLAARLQESQWEISNSAEHQRSEIAALQEKAKQEYLRGRIAVYEEGNTSVVDANPNEPHVAEMCACSEDLAKNCRCGFQPTTY